MKTLQSWSKIQESLILNPMVEKALEKGIPVLTEVELAYLISDAPIIGIQDQTEKRQQYDRRSLDGAGRGVSGNISFQLVKLHKQQQKRMFWSWNCLLSIDGVKPSIQRLQ